MSLHKHAWNKQVKGCYDKNLKCRVRRETDTCIFLIVNGAYLFLLLTNFLGLHFYYKILEM